MTGCCWNSGNSIILDCDCPTTLEQTGMEEFGALLIILLNAISDYEFLIDLGKYFGRGSLLGLYKFGSPPCYL